MTNSLSIPGNIPTDVGYYQGYLGLTFDIIDITLMFLNIATACLTSNALYNVWPLLGFAQGSLKIKARSVVTI
jgi:hypothetical protein